MYNVVCCIKWFATMMMLMLSSRSNDDDREFGGEGSDFGN